MTLMAAFDALLYRYTGQRRSHGRVSHLRSRWAGFIGQLLGFFVNTLAAAHRSSPETQTVFPPRAFLRRVRENCLAAYEHKELPFRTTGREW